MLQGGFYMGGDYVKHSFPLATNMAMLGWSLLRFRDAYQQVGLSTALRSELPHTQAAVFSMNDSINRVTNNLKHTGFA